MDESIHPMILYENCHIYIFMNVNESYKMRGLPLAKLVALGVIRPIINP